MTRILTPFRPQSTSEVAQGIDFSRQWKFITGVASFKRGLTQSSISGMTSNPSSLRNQPRRLFRSGS